MFFVRRFINWVWGKHCCSDCKHNAECSENTICRENHWKFCKNWKLSMDWRKNDMRNVTKARKRKT